MDVNPSVLISIRFFYLSPVNLISGWDKHNCLYYNNHFHLFEFIPFSEATLKAHAITFANKVELDTDIRPDDV